MMNFTEEEYDARVKKVIEQVTMAISTRLVELADELDGTDISVREVLMVVATSIQQTNAKLYHNN
jgi:hypothetical protein